MSELRCLAQLYRMINCSRFRCFCVLAMLAVFFLLIIFSSIGPSSSALLITSNTGLNIRLTADVSSQNSQLNSLGQQAPLNEADFVYDPSHDVLVFLHMQKTSGSVFGRHLIHEAVGFPALCHRIRGRKRHNCTRSNGHEWLFSRHSTGWACGLHADWTELHACVARALNRIEGVRRRRRYVYFSFLRDPIYRYLSEFKHVQRGATWKGVKLMCNGESAAGTVIPFCYSGEDWLGVSLDEFMSCPYNLANNRQTRMLADLTLVGCYNLSAFADSSERDRIMLQSAMNNLRDMVFFGLTERQVDSQHLFEHTFGVHFTEDFVQRNNTNADRVNVTDDQIRTIESLNHLDMQLYRFAVQLFDERVQRLHALEHQGVVRRDTASHRLFSQSSGIGRKLVKLAKN